MSIMYVCQEEEKELSRQEAPGACLKCGGNVEAVDCANKWRTIRDTMDNSERLYVDVRDLSEAILLLYENPKSKWRYICSKYLLRTKEFIAKMASFFPGYSYPKTFTEKTGHTLLISKKLLKLGWSYRPLEETIVDTIKNYEELGLLAKGKPFPSIITF
ncbi:hypothetical protein L2E82_36347 [Cichorium intybus]|uniref:Uncharacterized protein n=1 Tax=Cichorium intybus TaxID=13427 RepID=A0ACB9BRA0_CICIN|nr:hypothetical protein L2E82_36347 [Cichorium intybus]